MIPSRLKPFIHLGAILTVMAVTGIVTGTRMQQRGQWLPEVPNEIGPWRAIDVPLESTTVKLLGAPKTLGRQYKNPFDEPVDVHVISGESFDAYHEPAMCMSGYGFTLTAQIFPRVFEKDNSARAMVLKHEDSGVRILMLFWVQYEDGSTSGIGDMHAYGDISQRMNVGWNTVMNGKQCVIVRAYTRIAPGDGSGAQARRNLYEVSRGMYKGIKNDGSIWRDRSSKLARISLGEINDAS
ncbi:MAG: exosortase-associated EpsI family protein [Akkermansiaceae bacterium]|nr:exosortase-associated EpsI family protein [Armatimonadota bacterium]